MSRSIFSLWLDRIIGLVGLSWLVLLVVIVLFSNCGHAQTIPVNKVYWHNREYALITQIRIIDPICNNSPCYGLTSCQGAFIKIINDAPEFTGGQRVIVFHELQHVVEGCSDLDTTQHHAIYDVSQPLMKLLRDPRNVALKDWLFNASD